MSHSILRSYLASLFLVGVLGCTGDQSNVQVESGEPTASTALSTGSELTNASPTSAAGVENSPESSVFGDGDGWSAHGILGHPWSSDVVDVTLEMPEAVREDRIQCGILFSVVRVPGVRLSFNEIDGLYRFTIEDASLPSAGGGVRLGMSFGEIQEAFPAATIVAQGSTPDEYWWEVPEDPQTDGGKISGYLDGKSDSSRSIGVITVTMSGYFEKCAR